MRIASVADLDGDDQLRDRRALRRARLDEQRGVRLYSSREERVRSRCRIPLPIVIASRQGAFVVRADRSQAGLGWQTDEGERELFCLDPRLLRAQCRNGGCRSPREGSLRPDLLEERARRRRRRGRLAGFRDRRSGHRVSEGEVRVCSGRDGHLIRRVQSHAELWRFGATVVALGDVDSDLIGDFAVGCDHSRSHEPGEVRVFSDTRAGCCAEFDATAEC
jgi:hypothetical protein